MWVNKRESREQQVVRAPVHAQTTRWSHSFTDTTQIFEQKKDCSQSYNVVALARIDLEVVVFEIPATGPTVEKVFCEVASGNINKTKGFPESLGIVEGVVGVYYNKLEFGCELIKAVGCKKISLT